eukprot:scaffold13969_cov125-Isochrysis_galbana.AAC.8
MNSQTSGEACQNFDAADRRRDRDGRAVPLNEPRPRPNGARNSARLSVVRAPSAAGLRLARRTTADWVGWLAAAERRCSVGGSVWLGVLGR